MNEITNTTEPQIAYSECCTQPFFRQKDVEIWNENNIDTMKRMPDNYIDLVVTSPPYDGLRTYNGYSFPFEEIAKELYRVIKQGGVVVWVVGDATVNGSETGTSFKQALYFMECGFNLHDTMIYEKPSPFPGNVRYDHDFEYMFVFSKSTPITFNLLTQTKSNNTRIVKSKTDCQKGVRNKNGDIVKISKNGIDRFINAGKLNYTSKSNIWYYPAGYMLTTLDKIAFEHPATYPEKLAADHIYSWSNEGDLVYDPFGGSGTTAKMAHLQKRKCIMSEISLEYCQIAKKRIEPYLMQERLF
jgi:site-specific DNA-methyltransferase (adenine-specific)